MRVLHVFWRSHAHAVRTHPYMPVAKVLPHCDQVHVWNTLAKPWWTHIFTLMRAVSSCGAQTLRPPCRPWLVTCPASISSSTRAHTSTTAAHNWHNSIITAAYHSTAATPHLYTVFRRPCSSSTGGGPSVLPVCTPCSMNVPPSMNSGAAAVSLPSIRHEPVPCHVSPHDEQQLRVAGGELYRGQRAVHLD